MVRITCRLLGGSGVGERNRIQISTTTTAEGHNSLVTPGLFRAGHDRTGHLQLIPRYGRDGNHHYRIGAPLRGLIRRAGKKNGCNLARINNFLFFRSHAERNDGTLLRCHRRGQEKYFPLRMLFSGQKKTRNPIEK